MLNGTLFPDSAVARPLKNLVKASAPALASPAVASVRVPLRAEPAIARYRRQQPA